MHFAFARIEREAHGNGTTDPARHDGASLQTYLSNHFALQRDVRKTPPDSSDGEGYEDAEESEARSDLMGEWRGVPGLGLSGARPSDSEEDETASNPLLAARRRRHQA